MEMVLQRIIMLQASLTRTKAKIISLSVFKRLHVSIDCILNYHWYCIRIIKRLQKCKKFLLKTQWKRVYTQFLDSNKIIKKIYKTANEIGSIVNKPADHSQVLPRPKVCSLQNAIEVNIDGKLFCLAHLGQRKHKDALQLCHSLNATLPLPTSIKEHNHFIESFRRLRIEKKLNDLSTKIVLDVHRLSHKGRVSLFLRGPVD